MIIGKSSELSYDTKKNARWDRTAAERKMAAGAAPPQAENPASGILFHMKRKRGCREFIKMDD